LEQLEQLEPLERIVELFASCLVSLLSASGMLQ
jgi:hypothetical protein